MQIMHQLSDLFAWPLDGEFSKTSRVPLLVWGRSAVNNYMHVECLAWAKNSLALPLGLREM